MMLVSADGSTEALALADAGSTAAFNKKMMAFAKSWSYRYKNLQYDWYFA